MQNSLTKAKTFCSEHRGAFLMLGMFVCVSGLAVASTSGSSGSNDAAFKNGYDWFDSVIHGHLGTLLAAIAFIVGLVVGIAKQAPMAVVGGIIFALLIAFGPDMATGIVNSSLINSPEQSSISVFQLGVFALLVAFGLHKAKGTVNTSLIHYRNI